MTNTGKTSPPPLPPPQTDQDIEKLRRSELNRANGTNGSRKHHNKW